MSFADLKRKSQNNFSYLQKELEKSSSGKNVDERFWKPEVDAAGNGYAVIRFLPATEGESIPWAKVYSHAFQGVGGWYIENSLTTLGQKDPLGEYNRELWNSGNESDKDTVRKQKRKLSYYSNIYVVQDKANPENEGRVFLYKYGKKIFDKIMEAMQPEFEDETPINPFDFWQGANFKLKIKKVAGYWNYDSSEFDKTSQLFEDDDAMEAVWEKQHSLEQIIAADQFKTYDQLEARLKLVLGQKKSVPSFDESYEDESEGRGSFTPDFASKVANDPIAGKVDMGGSYEPVESKDSDEDDALSYFQKLAEE